MSGQLELETLFLRAGDAPHVTDIELDEAHLMSLEIHIWETYDKEYPN